MKIEQRLNKSGAELANLALTLCKSPLRRWIPIALWVGGIVCGALTGGEEPQMEQTMAALPDQDSQQNHIRTMALGSPLEITYAGGHALSPTVAQRIDLVAGLYNDGKVSQVEAAQLLRFGELLSEGPAGEHAHIMECLALLVERDRIPLTQPALTAAAYRIEDRWQHHDYRGELLRLRQAGIEVEMPQQGRILRAVANELLQKQPQALVQLEARDYLAAIEAAERAHGLIPVDQPVPEAEPEPPRPAFSF